MLHVLACASRLSIGFVPMPFPFPGFPVFLELSVWDALAAWWHAAVAGRQVD